MSFGFSFGDFATAITLVKKIRREFIDAPSQFAEISDEARNLSIVLGDIDALSEPDLSSQQQNHLKEIVNSCRDVLETLERTLDKYWELQPRTENIRRKMNRVWKQLQWEPSEIHDLRLRMIVVITLLRGFLQTIERQTSRAIKAGVDHLNERQDSRERREEKQMILDWLSAIDYAPQQNDLIKQRQAGTGQWLLELPDFQEWLGTGKKTLFGRGIPGSGKTILTSVVIQHLLSRFFNDQAAGIAYVYCNFRRENEQKAVDLLASLLKQLAQRQCSLPGSVKSMYERHKANRTEPSFDEVSRTLQSVASMYSRIFIVIDALDECQTFDGSRTRLLAEIFNIQAKTGANVFATSRDIPEITEKFQGSTLLEIRADEEDVRKYLDDNMFRMPAFIRARPDLEKEIKTGIAQSVQGMFLLAQLLVSSLIGKRSPKAVQAFLADLPAGSATDILNHVYKDAMERIESQGRDQADLAKQVLAWITHAKTPLTVLELQHALAIDQADFDLDKDNLPQIEDIISVCVGLVAVDEESSIIRLTHYTTQQYLERYQDPWFPNAKAEIAEICVTYLSFDTFDSGFCSTDMEFEERLQLYPLYSYAARNWGHHVRVASMQRNCLIQRFLESEGKVSASSQAMMANKLGSWHSDYSQEAPVHVTGLHLAAYFGLDQVITTLAKRIIDPDSADSHGRTALSWAAESGHVEVVERLLDNPIELDSKDEHDWTPLSWAAFNGHAKVVELLIDKDADPDPYDTNGNTPLSMAAIKGYEPVVQLLLSNTRVNPDKKLHCGETPLWRAASKGHEGVVRRLLAFSNVDPNSKNLEERTPLWIAASYGHEKVIKLLLDEGVDPDPIDADDRSALSIAAGNGHKGVVDILLANEEVDPGSFSKWGHTPLSYAAAFGHETIVETLLTNDQVDLESQDKFGRTPLWSAVANGHIEVIDLLLKKGVNLNAKDDENRTPLWWAAVLGQDAVVKLLLQHGIDPESTDDSGLTPLSFAAGKGHKGVVELLLADDRVSPDFRDKWGGAPLFWATVNGNESVIELLRTKAVQADEADEIDLAPLVEAAIEGDEAVIELLLSESAVDILLELTRLTDPDIHHFLLQKHPQWQYSRALRVREPSQRPSS